MTHTHPSGWFTYERVETNDEVQHFQQCRLLQHVAFDACQARSSYYMPVTMHNDTECGQGSQFACISQQGPHLVGWKTNRDEPSLDVNWQ
jgi:hypothetical protein